MLTSTLSTHTATRYVQPLREGGSLPAIVDTDGGGLFVVKFRGAGQGVKVLVAEVIVGELARAVGLPVPELALVDILPQFGRSEPDSEIQEILKGSHGLNVALRYLDGAFNFDGSAAGQYVTPALATRLVWFDAFVSNVDRTHRNPNLLIWNHEPWLIDHGSALYVHHDWHSVDDAKARAPFPLVRQHVLLALTEDLAATDAEMTALLQGDVIERVVALVPDEWLAGPLAGSDFATPTEARERYVRYLKARLAAPRAFVASAMEARTQAAHEPPRRLKSRR